MRILGVPLALIIILIFSNIIAWGGFFWSYHVFTQEEPILTIRFKEQGSKKYLAYIDSPKSVAGEYDIYGEQWRVDARFVKMKYWANLLGQESRYSLDRLQGRYIDINDENALPKLAHQLKGSDISHFSIFGWSPFVDISYGSSTYQVIDVNKSFFIYKTPTGLITRSGPLESKSSDNWFNGFFSRDARTAQ